MNKNWTLYVLKLEQEKWYVGITSKTPEQRMLEHSTGRGANWTRKYKPLKLHYTQNLNFDDVERAQLFEGRVTREYMEKYGDNNVRGGDLTDKDEYVRRFGNLWLKNDWETLTFVVFLMLMIVILLIDKYV